MDLEPQKHDIIPSTSRTESEQRKRSKINYLCCGLSRLVPDIHSDKQNGSTQEKGTMSIELKATTQSTVDTPPSNVDTPPSPAPSSVSSMSTDRGTPESGDLPTTSTAWYARASVRTLSATFSDQFNMQDDGQQKWKGMLKSHYVDKKTRDKCHGCSKPFKLKRRPRHCRRCGELFCFDCLQYKRRLNKLAHPDPEGESRKVCMACYNEDAQVLGQTRSCTGEFHKERHMSKNERILNQRANSKTQTFWRDQLDILTECKRLIDGFERNVSQSESKKTMQDLRSLVEVPRWQKSKFWQVEKVSRQCRQCKRSLGLRKTKRNCRVCSIALCKKCSFKELLIYYDDESPNGPRRAKLSLINVNGCPEKEPNISLLMYVCMECKDSIQGKQQDNHVWYESLRDDSPLAEINNMNTLFVTLTKDIAAGLQKFQDDGHPDKQSNKRNNELALLDIRLNEFHTLFKSLQKVLARSESTKQHMFIKNFSRGRYDFYMQAKHDYNKLKEHFKSQQ